MRAWGWQGAVSTAASCALAPWFGRTGRPPTLPPASGPAIWWHGASLGDVRALAPLRAEVQARYPHLDYVSAWTTAGIQEAGTLGAHWAGPAPMDAPRPMAELVTAMQPELLVLERAELWPWMLERVMARHARVAVVNGVLGPRYRQHGRWLRRFGDPMPRVDLVVARTDQDAQRFCALGVPESRVEVDADTKLDGLEAPRPTAELQAVFRGRFWVAAGCHPEEFDGLLEAQRALQKEASARLVLAPRHPRRASRALARARRLGLRAALRSDLRPGAEAPAVVVLDTLGELRHLLALATLVVLGGSFGRRCQNPYEAARAGRLLLAGPRGGSFEAELASLESAGGLVRIPRMGELGRALPHWWPPQRRSRVEAAALAWLDAQRGGATRTAERLRKLLLTPRVQAS